MSLSANKNRLRVVAAVIVHDNKILIGQRPFGGVRGGKWEFPGGKVRGGETDIQALRREIREELNLEITDEHRLEETEHDYADLKVKIVFYQCRIPANDEVHSQEHASLAWVTPEEIRQFDFLEADLAFIQKLPKLLS